MIELRGNRPRVRQRALRREVRYGVGYHETVWCRVPNRAKEHLGARIAKCEEVPHFHGIEPFDHELLVQLGVAEREALAAKKTMQEGFGLQAQSEEQRRLDTREAPRVGRLAASRPNVVGENDHLHAFPTAVEAMRVRRLARGGSPECAPELAKAHSLRVPRSLGVRQKPELRP